MLRHLNILKRTWYIDIRLFLIILIVLSSFSAGCINRDESENNTNGTGEVTMTYSGALTGQFASDSVMVLVNYSGSPGLWTLSISAIEYPPGNTLTFTIPAMELPGSMDIDSTTTYGAASYNDISGTIFLSQTSGGSGAIIVDVFQAQEHIAGSFNFTLLDTSSGEQLFIEEGIFDADIDVSPY